MKKGVNFVQYIIFPSVFLLNITLHSAGKKDQYIVHTDSSSIPRPRFPSGISLTSAPAMFLAIVFPSYHMEGSTSFYKEEKIPKIHSKEKYSRNIFYVAWHKS